MQAFIEQWTRAGPQVHLLVGARFTIGRQASNDLVIADDPEVSKLHACLDRVGPTWVLRDLSSRNGTVVNGERLSADRPLADRDEIRVGTTRLVMRDTDEADLAPTATAEAPPALSPRERDVLMELFRPTLEPGPFTEPASTRDIATALVISEAAVKQHLSNLFDKFGIPVGIDRRRQRLANEALHRGAINFAELRARFPAG